MFLVQVKIPNDNSNQEVYVNPESIVFLSKVTPKKGETIYGLVAAGGVSMAITQETFDKILDFSESILPKVPDAFHLAWEPIEDDED
jgi:hypothetical protein